MTSSDAADTNATNTAGATATGHLITDRGLMIQMFRGLGFTEPVATHIVDQELIDNVAALRDLDDDRCESIAKIVRKVPIAAGSSTCHNVADKAVHNFQLAVAPLCRTPSRRQCLKGSRSNGKLRPSRRV